MRPIVVRRYWVGLQCAVRHDHSGAWERRLALEGYTEEVGYPGTEGIWHRVYIRTDALILRCRRCGVVLKEVPVP